MTKQKYADTPTIETTLGLVKTILSSEAELSTNPYTTLAMHELKTLAIFYREITTNSYIRQDDNQELKDINADALKALSIVLLEKYVNISLEALNIIEVDR